MPLRASLVPSVSSRLVPGARRAVFGAGESSVFGALATASCGRQARLSGMARKGSDMNLKWLIWAIPTVIVGVTAFVWFLNYLGVHYTVWKQKTLANLRIVTAERKGQADLAQAHNDQQVQVAKAKGRLDAAQLNKEAEIIDAEAVAKSVEIIGTALHNNHGYLQWKWIHMMEERDSGDTIYVPTEAGLPILEAGKRPSTAS